MNLYDGIKKFHATIEKFTDSPSALISMLKQVNFYEKLRVSSPLYATIIRNPN